MFTTHKSKFTVTTILRKQQTQFTVTQFVDSGFSIKMAKLPHFPSKMSGGSSETADLVHSVVQSWARIFIFSVSLLISSPILLVRHVIGNN
jgi:hypothetical protein